VAVDLDGKLTRRAAEILRDAAQVYNQAGLAGTGNNPVLAGWSNGMYGGLEMTASFQAATGSFMAVTGAFPVLGQKAAAGEVTLKRVFRLPRRLPGVRLPGTAELAGTARSAPMMVKLEALARWLGGDGRLVTADDVLPEADAADAARVAGLPPGLLPYLWEYALVSGWFELIDEPDGRRSWAVLGPTAYRWADRDVPGTLHAWAVVFAAVLATMFEVAAGQAPDAAARLDFEGQGVALAVMLFLARRTGLTTASVTDTVRSGAIGERPARRTRRAWDEWVGRFGDPGRRLLSELAALRAVDLPAPASQAGQAGRPGQAGDLVTLTPLAQWALREQFRLDDITVPVVEESGQLSVAGLMGLADGVSDAEFSAELSAWLERRGPGRAAMDLVMYAGSASARTRLTAVGIIRGLGPAATPAWLDAMQQPQLRGYARIALSMMAADVPKSSLPLVLNPGPDDMTWLATDLLALIADDDDPDPDPDRVKELFAEIVPPGQEGWVLGQLARASSPDVIRALKLLARYHPNGNIAKAARKAARAAAKNARNQPRGRRGRPPAGAVRQ